MDGRCQEDNGCVHILYNVKICNQMDNFLHHTHYKYTYCRTMIKLWQWNRSPITPTNHSYGMSFFISDFWSLFHHTWWRVNLGVWLLCSSIICSMLKTIIQWLSKHTHETIIIWYYKIHYQNHVHRYTFASKHSHVYDKDIFTMKHMMTKDQCVGPMVINSQRVDYVYDDKRPMSSMAYDDKQPIGD